MKKPKPHPLPPGMPLLAALFAAAFLLSSPVLADRAASGSPAGRSRFHVTGTKWIEKKSVKRIYYQCDNGRTFYYDRRLTEPEGCNYHDDLGWVACFPRAEQQQEKFERLCGYK